MKMVTPLLREVPTSARGTVTTANTNIKHHMDHLLTQGFAQASMVPIFGNDSLFPLESVHEFIREYRALIEFAREQVARGEVRSLRGYGNLMNDLAKIHRGEKGITPVAPEPPCWRLIFGEIFTLVTALSGLSHSVWGRYVRVSMTKLIFTPSTGFGKRPA
jgi:hypothetical protein